MNSQTPFASAALLALSISATTFGQSCPDPLPYCNSLPNSTGAGATISWLGRATPGSSDFWLVATNCPVNQPLIFYYGGAPISQPFGNGLRCASDGGVGVYRFQPTITDSAGVARLRLDYDAPPAGLGAGDWTPGESWYCQGWFRDPAAGGAFHNLTDGLEVQVCSGCDAYCGMAVLPGGEFEMGRHVGSGDPDELPVHTVRLVPFYMDRFEVTVGEFADFLNEQYALGRVTDGTHRVYQIGGAGEGICDTANSSFESLLDWDAANARFEVVASRNPALPMQKVSWFGACLFANARSVADGLNPQYDETSFDRVPGANGYRLPTEGVGVRGPWRTAGALPEVAVGQRGRWFERELPRIG